MRKGSCLWYVCAVGLILACGPASAQVCPPDGTNNDALIRFLRTAKALDSAQLCVVNAIKQLQYAHSQKAIDVLVQYLDFQRDAGRSEVVVTGSNSEAYPAVDSLFVIGKSALPSLVLVVGDDGFTRTAQENAVRTIMIIHRDHPTEGISLLMTEAHRSQDARRKALFSQAAMFALRWCQGKDQNECESLVGQR